MAIDDLLDEHEQGERVRTWLRKNALGILGGLALGIAAIYGWRAWVSHQASQHHGVGFGFRHRHGNDVAAI